MSSAIDASIFWRAKSSYFRPAAISHFLYWPDEVPWLRIVCGALAIRLLFLGRREPLLCFATLSCWAFVNLGLMLEFEVFLLVALVAGSQRAFEHPQRFYLAFPAFAVLLLFLRFDVDHWPSFNPMTISGLKRQAAEWRGDWGMRPYSQSEDFKLTRWLVENPPRGRVYAGSLSLRNRLNAWVPYAQVGSLMQLRVNGSFSLPSDATLLALGTEYSVDMFPRNEGFRLLSKFPPG